GPSGGRSAIHRAAAAHPSPPAARRAPNPATSSATAIRPVKLANPEFRVEADRAESARLSRLPIVPLGAQRESRRLAITPTQKATRRLVKGRSSTCRLITLT